MVLSFLKYRPPLHFCSNEPVDDFSFDILASYYSFDDTGNFLDSKSCDHAGYYTISFTMVDHGTTTLPTTPTTFGHGTSIVPNPFTCSTWTPYNLIRPPFWTSIEPSDGITCYIKPSTHVNYTSYVCLLGHGNTSSVIYTFAVIYYATTC